jgi:hypothetical protein
LNAWHAGEQARLAEARAAEHAAERAWRRGWALALLWAGLLAASLSALLLRSAPQQAWRGSVNVAARPWCLSSSAGARPGPC